MKYSEAVALSSFYRMKVRNEQPAANLCYPDVNLS